MNRLRDLGVALIVVAVVGGALWARSRVDYQIPITFGGRGISNVEAIAEQADAKFKEVWQATGGEIAEGARCYFYRPLGPAGSIFDSDMGKSLGEIAEFTAFGPEESKQKTTGVDFMICGPAKLKSPDVEIGGLNFRLIPGALWSGAMVLYSDNGDGSHKGKVTWVTPGMGLVDTVRPEHLLLADGENPDPASIAHPKWQHVKPNGEPVPQPEIPGLPSPELPGSGEDKGGEGEEEAPGTPEVPGAPEVTLPPDLTVPSFPEGPGG